VKDFHLKMRYEVLLTLDFNILNKTLFVRPQLLDYHWVRKVWREEVMKGLDGSFAGLEGCGLW